MTYLDNALQAHRASKLLGRAELAEQMNAIIAEAGSPSSAIERIRELAEQAVEEFRQAHL